MQLQGNLIWTGGIAVISCAVLHALMTFMRRSNKDGSQLPKVRGYPILGNAFDLGIDVILGNLARHIKAYGKNFKLQALNKRFVHISEAKACREILQKRPKLLKRGVALESFAQIMGYLPFGLFHANEPAVWSKMKKMTAPAFSKQNIQNMARVFFDECMEMVQKLNKAAADDATVDMTRIASSLTVNVINKVAFGNEHVDYFFDNQFYEDASLSLRVMLEDAMFQLPRWVWKLTPMYQSELQAAEGNQRLEAACNEVIRRKRAQHEHMSEAQKRELHDLIDIMLRQEGATDEEVLANVKTFYLAGSDTTSVSICWTLLLLAQHPEVVTKMREEVRGLFALPVQEMTAPAISDAIAALTYTLAVFKEAVRLYPVGPLFFFDFLEPEPLTLSNGVTIHHDQTILLNIWACLLDEDNFKDAKSFLPARWLTEDKEVLQTMETAFLTFGGGTRTCPGMGLALSEGVMALAALVHHFDFELACPAEEVKVVYKFTMQPNKLPIKFKPRVSM